MVNRLHSYSGFLAPLHYALQRPLIHLFTLKFTDHWVAVAMQGSVSPIGTSLGLSVWPKDTRTD